MDAGTRLRVGAQDVGRYGRTVFLAAVAVTGWSLSAGLTGQALPRLTMLATLKDGLWELRQRGSTTVDRVCTRDGLGLIQLRHPGRACDRLVLEQADHAIVVQYTCKGSGFGRTRIRRETPQLVQIETQGVADGFPFDYAVEGRWVGECPRVAG